MRLSLAEDARRRGPDRDRWGGPKRTPRIVLLHLVITLLLAGCAGPEDVRGGADGLPGPVPTNVTFGEPPTGLPAAPPFTLTLMDGAEVSVAELWADRPVVLFFFASWCGACAEQQALLADLLDEHGDAIAVLGIAGEDTPEDVGAFLDEHEVGHAVGIDPDLGIWRSYAALEPPLVAVVSRGGTLVRGFPGGVSADQLDQVMAELISG